MKFVDKSFSDFKSLVISDYSTPKIQDSSKIINQHDDDNKNKITDTLDQKIESKNTGYVDVIIGLDHSPNADDFQSIHQFNGVVLNAWNNVVYAIHAQIPVDKITEYANQESVVLIEENAKIHSHLDASVKQMSVRPTVWSTYGYQGDSNHAVAVLDTGIDDSHPDLSGKIITWKDFTSLNYSNPSDKGEHGTHCASIIAGNGSASGINTKEYTWSHFFDVPTDSVLVKKASPTEDGTLTLSMKWDDDYKDGSGKGTIWIDANHDEIIDSDECMNSYSPMMYSEAVASGDIMIGVGPEDTESYLEDFYLQVSSPSSNTDGFNLLKGVAPECSLAGLKVLGDDGKGYVSDLIDAFDWLYTNASDNNIICASLSLGTNSVNQTLDTLVNNLVSSGIPCVVSAGNSQGDNTICSPGTAAKAITVGAVNDHESLTDYSSIGDTNNDIIKPDVLAPGGSFNVGDEIIAADSNDADWTNELDEDKYPDDYRCMTGTSMACPHVSGLVALIADALPMWNYSEYQALKIKQLILMTAIEVESAENTSFIPPFNHGGKDNMEGYGRVCGNAAIQAATRYFSPDNNTFSFGETPENNKVWARQINLSSGKTYGFQLTVPSTGNFDIYLYDDEPDNNGEPQLISSSYNTNSTNETIEINPTKTDSFYIVSKWRGGTGQAQVSFFNNLSCNFLFTPLNPTTLESVNFTDESNDSDITSWLWNFDDGNTSIEQNPTHTYMDNGVYQVKLTVTDDYGNTNNTTKMINVSNQKPIANFTCEPNQPVQNEILYFNDSSYDVDGTIVNWTWNFDDGNISYEQNTTHHFNQPGFYNVTLEITDNDFDTDQITIQIPINAVPQASFTITPNNPNTTDTISFSDTSTDGFGEITDWSWIFGDGNFSTQQHPTHSYEDNGTYYVTLNVTDKYSATNQTTIPLTVLNVPPSANFTYQPTHPTIFDTISFTDTSTDPDGKIVNYTWEFENNTYSYSQNTTYNYSQNGNKTVNLTLVDDDGEQVTISKNITIYNILPQPIFNYTPQLPTTADNIIFNATESLDQDGHIVNWTWYLGDGNISYGQQITYNYSDDGSYDVNLTVTDDNNGRCFIIKTVNVGNQPPITRFSYDPVNPFTNDLIFLNTTSYDIDGNVVNLTWKINNNFIFYGKNITHSFSDDGNYIITLHSTDDDGASSNETQTITVRNRAPKSNFSFVPENPSTADIIDFNSTANDTDGNIVNWTWVFGDETKGYGEFVKHSYDDNGTYMVNLTVKDDDNAMDYFSMNIPVSNVAPLVNNDSDSCDEDNSVWTDVISNDNDSDGTLDFSTLQLISGPSDGNTTVNNTAGMIKYTPDANYHGSDSYEYSIADDDGDSDTATVNIIINDVNDVPNANFSYMPFNPRPNQTIHFSDQSEDIDGKVTDWNWDFDDGNFSTLQNLTHQYNKSGTYHVNLTVIDDDNATHSFDDYVVVSKGPIANFTWNPTIPYIKNKTFFTDLSTYDESPIVNWTWVFDDETISYEQNPENTFTDIGTFDVTLTVSDNLSNNQSITKQVIMTKRYKQNLSANNTNCINLSEEQLRLWITTTNSTNYTIHRYPTNPFDASMNKTFLNKFYSIEIENFDYVTPPIHIRFYYNETNLNNSNLNESQLLGGEFFNETKQEWQTYNDTGVNTTDDEHGNSGYVWINAWHLTNISVVGDNTPPSKVTDLSISDEHDGKLKLTWTKADDNIAVDHYRIYRDNNLTGNSSHLTYTDSGLINNQQYSYQVSAIDVKGNEGPKSSIVTGKPTESEEEDPPSPPSNPSGGSSGYSGGGFVGSMNIPPVANVSAGEPYTGVVGEVIWFDGSASFDSDGNISSWFWVFDDESNATGERVNHQFSQAGEYTVMLTVKDNDGVTDSCETVVSIRKPNNPPDLPRIFGPKTGSVDSMITFEVVSSDKDNDTLRYRVDWDDETVNTTDFFANNTRVQLHHFWDSSGVYMVKVFAEDEENAQSETNTFLFVVDVSVLFIDDVIEGYLLDSDNDEVFDVFHNNETHSETMVETMDDGSVLIDSNNDDQWDFSYVKDQGLLVYEASITQPSSESDEKEKTGIPWMFILIGIIAAVILVVVILFKTGILYIEEVDVEE